MAQFSLANLRFILDTEDQADAPNAEELLQQLRENLEVLFMLLLDTGISGSATEDPPDDATGVLTDAGSPAPFTADEHNDRTLVITSGTAKNTIYTIDDTTTTTLVCTDDNLYAAGVRSGDTYKILYDLINSTVGHGHNGTDSSTLIGVVGQAQLKTTIGTLNGLGNMTLPGGEYGFYPQIAGFSGVQPLVDEARIALARNCPTYVTSLYIAGSSGNCYASQRYVQASGEVHWVFVLRDKITKEIISMWQAPDHPCMGNGGKPLLVPHPFGDYDKIKHEIIVINPTEKELVEMRAKQSQPEDTPDKDLLDIIREDYDIDEISEPKWPTKKVTVGLPPDWDKAWLAQKPVTPIKKVIPKPDYILCKSLKLKNGKSL